MTSATAGISGQQRALLTEAVRKIIFSDNPAPAEKLVHDHVEHRYDLCLRHVLPWVARFHPLEGATMLEVGCGSGSTAAAFSPRVGRIHGYDIVPRVIDLARRRFEILGVENVDLHLVTAESLIGSLVRNHREGVDLVLLYAVLEHQLIQERLDTLRTAWLLLKPGGILVVADTPNRLTFNSFHTSDLPFFDMLPDEIALAWYDRSPRADFVRSMKAALQTSRDRAREVLDRWGRGVSFHEFELAIGPLDGLVVGDGFDPEMTEWIGVAYEEALLASYFVQERLPYALGFARRSLCLVLRKPVPGEPPAAPLERRLTPLSASELPFRVGMGWPAPPPRAQRPAEKNARIES